MNFMILRRGQWHREKSTIRETIFFTCGAGEEYSESVGKSVT